MCLDNIYDIRYTYHTISGYNKQVDNIDVNESYVDHFNVELDIYQKMKNNRQCLNFNLTKQIYYRNILQKPFHVNRID